MNRRDFLQLAAGTAIAMPALIRATAMPSLILPGVTRVEEMRRPALERRVHFANAVFTPGNLWGAEEIIRMNIHQHVLHGTRYQVRAYPLTAAEMGEYVRLRRPGWGVVWVAGEVPEEVIHGKSQLLGTYVAGDAVGYSITDWPIEIRDGGPELAVWDAVPGNPDFGRGDA